jgi:hypothetical protein
MEAHHSIRDALAKSLQRILTEAGYILPTAKLDTELAGVVASSRDIKPLDVSFDLDPHPDAQAASSCPYDTVGGDVTIVKPVPSTPALPNPDIATFIESVTATTESNLQTGERKKLVRTGTRPEIKDAGTGEDVSGQEIIRQIAARNVVMMPWAIDPHGRLGPLFQRFLYDIVPRQLLTFSDGCMHGRHIYMLGNTPPCPSGVVTSAYSRWKATATRKFYGGSYSAPTPTEYFDQQLGLAITKAFGMHLRRAEKRLLYVHLDPPPPLLASRPGPRL